MKNPFSLLLLMTHLQNALEAVTAVVQSGKAHQPRSIAAPFKDVEGLLYIDKPKYLGSSDVVRFISSILTFHVSNKKTKKPIFEDRDVSDGKKVNYFWSRPSREGPLTQWRPCSSPHRGTPKVGHGGTLDPLATGLLVIGVGKGTKMLGHLTKYDKTYVAEGVFGVETDTYDSQGEVVLTKTTQHITKDMVENRLNLFKGHIQQTPPIFSDIRHQGQRMYDLARNGQTADIQLESRPVHIQELTLTTFCNTPIETQQGPTFTLSIRCSSGTYVRSIIHDLGLACGSVAHMTSLVRTQYENSDHSIQLQQAITLNTLDDKSENWDDFIQCIHPLPHIPDSSTTTTTTTPSLSHSSSIPLDNAIKKRK